MARPRIIHRLRWYVNGKYMSTIIGGSNRSHSRFHSLPSTVAQVPVKRALKPFTPLLPRRMRNRAIRNRHSIFSNGSTHKPQIAPRVVCEQKRGTERALNRPRRALADSGAQRPQKDGCLCKSGSGKQSQFRNNLLASTRGFSFQLSNERLWRNSISTSSDAG